MVSPVLTIHSDQTLDVAVEEMFEIGGSSLVVVSEEDRPIGIVTKTDVLESLTGVRTEFGLSNSIVPTS